MNEKQIQTLAIQALCEQWLLNRGTEFETRDWRDCELTLEGAETALGAVWGLSLGDTDGSILMLGQLRQALKDLAGDDEEEDEGFQRKGD